MGLLSFRFFEIVGLFRLFRRLQVDFFCPACFRLYTVVNIILLLRLLRFGLVVFGRFNFC